MKPFDENDGPRLTDTEFRMFSVFIKDNCALYFGEESRFLFEKRLLRRMRELDLDSFSAYHYQLRNAVAGDDELALLIDELTTNETYFFRESKQLRALTDEIFVEIQSEQAERCGRPINVWCAGCSTGEEPYSIAILAREAGLRTSDDIRVYGSDISRRALHKARQGIYREASFRETNAQMRDRYFVEKDGLWQISDEIKKDVSFIHLNLMDRSKIALLGTMDVILCRNVMIYFDVDSRCEVLQTFYEKMYPGGHLLLGHAESLINLSTSFELRNLRNALVYRRPRLGMEQTDPWHLAASAAIAKFGDPEID